MHRPGDLYDFFVNSSLLWSLVFILSSFTSSPYSMFTLTLLLFTSVFVLLYSYLGYGFLLWIRSRVSRTFSRRPVDQWNINMPESGWPGVTMIVAAFNEADFVAEKIRNTLELDYPTVKFQVIFITDGSSDSTPELVQSFPGVELLHQPERRGKVAAIHRAVPFARHPILIFSDANTILNKEAVREIAKHYQDPKVGGVAGEKKIMQDGQQGIAGAGEGLYWKYESTLKKLDSEYYSVVGAAGELFSIRTALYENPGEHVLLDDFIISLRICQHGYRVKYEPKAFAMETPSSSIKEEQKRKIRISAGAFQSMWMLRALCNPFRYGKLTFQYISHRVLRWTLSPLALPVILVTNIVMVFHGAGLIFQLLLAGQALFYVAALAGYLLYLRKIKSALLYVPYYFLFINICLYIGFWKFLKGNQSVLWDKAARARYSVQKAP